jgi:DNA-binding CsgD family transcriptional regulator/tetratricopeptide (TPR) repeat protein
MDLLERHAELATLDAALADAAGGKGRLVLISGEAGIGKTRLTRTFTDRHATDAVVVWGACDDLSTPRPLGPFRDIATQLGGGLAEMLSTGPSLTAVFDAVLDALEHGRTPKVLVIEDVHWADAATFDVITFLGRRVERLPTVLIVTSRTEDLEATQRLRVAVGDIPATSVRRLEPRPLSKEAVVEMARDYHGQTDALYEVTGGNPFLVTEALTLPDVGVPASVRDAVAARLARLGPAAQATAEAASVIPGQAERWLLSEMANDSVAALDECKSRGLIDYDEWLVWYRHELVRGAVRNSLSPQRRWELNQRALAALIEAGSDVARIIHHAREAGDRRAIATYAPTAARQASEVSSHREAAAHYRLAIGHADLLEPAERAQLFLDFAIEAYLVNEAADGVEPAREALAIWRTLGDVEHEGLTLRWLSRFSWWMGQSADAIAFGRAAIEALEQVPHSRELPMAYSNLAQLSMLAQDTEPAIHWATRAIESARAAGDQITLVHALNNLGSTQARMGDLAGFERIRESLEVSVREGLEDHAGRAYANLIWTLLDYREFDQAARYLDEGLGYVAKHELAGSAYYLRAERARLRFATGDWSGADADVEWVMSRPEEPGITQMPALATRAHLRVRRGDPDAEESLAHAWSVAKPTGELQRISAVAVAQGELAWLRDDKAGIRAAVNSAYQQACDVGQPWILDELAFWMWRSGIDPDVLEGSGTPYVDQINGGWQSAADAWEALGCTYERATALLDAPEPEPLLVALELLHELGAVPAARLVRRKLRALGFTGVPRGPRPQTRANPAGLTNRQLEVLGLMTEGLTNAEIAERLFVSAKTVDHHVSAVLQKLEASSRQEASAAAARLGLVPGGSGRAAT